MMGKGTFVAGLAVPCLALGVGLTQVPQPLRGYLIAWLLVFFTLGLGVLRVLSHIARMKEIEGQYGKKDIAYTIGWSEPKQGRGEGKLRVINMSSGGHGRFELR